MGIFVPLVVCLVYSLHTRIMRSLERLKRRLVPFYSLRPFFVQFFLVFFSFFLALRAIKTTGLEVKLINLERQGPSIKAGYTKMSEVFFSRVCEYPMGKEPFWQSTEQQIHLGA